MKPEMMKMHPESPSLSWHPCLLPGREVEDRRCPCCGAGQSGGRQRAGAVDRRCSEPLEPSPSTFPLHQITSLLLFLQQRLCPRTVCLWGLFVPPAAACPQPPPAGHGAGHNCRSHGGLRKR